MLIVNLVLSLKTLAVLIYVLLLVELEGAIINELGLVVGVESLD